MRTIFLFGTLILFQVHTSNAADLFQTETPVAVTTQHVFRHDPYQADQNKKLLTAIISGYVREASGLPYPMIKHYMRLAPRLHEIADTQTIQLFNQRLLEFLDSEFHRLVEFRVSIGDEDCVEEQYKQVHLFIKAVLPFCAEIYERLQCYHVTFLIGMANIAGAKRNNLGQRSAAGEALAITNSLREWIEHAYIDGRNFQRSSVRGVCEMIIQRANDHLYMYYSNQ